MEKLFISLKFAMSVIGLLWVVHVIGWIIPPIKQLGIQPWTIHGLFGIFFAPFLHGSISHLLSNSIGLLIFLTLIAWVDPLKMFRAIFIITVISGLGTWVLSSGNTIGASGVVCGLSSYLLVLWFYNRSYKSFIVAVGLVSIFGLSLIANLIPMPGVSWTAHAFGFFGGIVAAISNGKMRRQSMKAFASLLVLSFIPLIANAGELPAGHPRYVTYLDEFFVLLVTLGIAAVIGIIVFSVKLKRAQVTTIVGATTLFIATVGYSGFLPRLFTKRGLGAGFIGSLVGLLILVICLHLQWSIWTMLFITFVSYVIGLTVLPLSESIILRLYGPRFDDDGEVIQHDFNETCIDELHGQLVAGWPVFLFPAIGHQNQLFMFLVSFVIFRILDVWKPGPIGYIDQYVKEPEGVMLDDTLAGLMTAIIVFLAMIIFNQP
jgi:phosphatidylglycerophosphatase A/membrane associated rhomboid family serine protease